MAQARNTRTDDAKATADAPEAQPDTEAVQPETSGAPDTAALEARLAQLEAENAALREAAELPAPSGESRMVWLVTYPQISVQPKDDDGEPLKDKDGATVPPVILQRGEALPENCAWQADQLKSFGYVTAVTVPAT